MELTDVLINIFSSILNNILQSLKHTIVNIILKKEAIFFFYRSQVFTVTAAMCHVNMSVMLIP